jgi:hypothetical protein
MTIQRYEPCTPIHAYDYKRLVKSDHGDVVLYTDHLAAMKETLNFADLERATYKKQIAALTARIKELTEALEMLSGHDDRFVRETAQAALGGKDD